MKMVPLKLNNTDDGSPTWYFITPKTVNKFSLPYLLGYRGYGDNPEFPGLLFVKFIVTKAHGY